MDGLVVALAVVAGALLLVWAVATLGLSALQGLAQRLAAAQPDTALAECRIGHWYRPGCREFDPVRHLEFRIAMERRRLNDTGQRYRELHALRRQYLGQAEPANVVDIRRAR